MGWSWRREGRVFVATVPSWIGDGIARAERREHVWHLEVGDWRARVVNPRLRTWLSAREVVETVVRCHFHGAVAVNSTGQMV